MDSFTFDYLSIALTSVAHRSHHNLLYQSLFKWCFIYLFIAYYSLFTRWVHFVSVQLTTTPTIITWQMMHSRVNNWHGYRSSAACQECVRPRGRARESLPGPVCKICKTFSRTLSHLRLFLCRLSSTCLCSISADDRLSHCRQSHFFVHSFAFSLPLATSLTRRLCHSFVSLSVCPVV